MTRSPRRLAAPVLLCLLAAAPAARASVTQFWTARTAADYRQARLAGAAVSPDGTLRLGVEVSPVDLPGADVAWAVLGEEGGALVGSGHAGVVFRVASGGRVASADSTGAGQVLCLARGPDGAVYAGTAPDGRILRYAAGRFETWFETGDKYVWALAWSGHTLYAATGPEGRLFAVRDRQRGEPVFKAPEGQLTSLAADGGGGVFVGGSGGGTVYWHKPGRTRALFDAPETEIRSLVFQAGALYAAAVSAAPVQVEQSGRVAPGAGGSAEPKSVVYRIVPDSSVTTWWKSPQGLVFALAPRPGGGLWAATGADAALYALDARGRAESVYQATEGYATALAGDGSGLWMATAAPARLYRVRAPAARGEAESDVLDAARLARWGRFTALGELAAVRFATRSGNSSDPDSTWSDWQQARPGAAVASPAARYLQWRAQLAGAGSVREVRVAYAEVNQPPRIEEFAVQPEPGKFYAGEISPRQEPVTQILPGGQRVQYSTPSPPPGPPDVLPTWARGLRPIAWKASDPNGDPLSYQLEYRRTGTAAWVLIGETVEASPFTWDTNGLEEGEYETRLTASDELRQGDDALTDEVLSGPVVVDNTPPTVAGLEVRSPGSAVTVRGEARDAGLYVAKVDVAVGEYDWALASADDGIWDGPAERFRVSVTGLPPGVYPVRVRVADAVGNVALFTSSVTVRP